jgi:phosphoesterase RecJ-like protein
MYYSQSEKILEEIKSSNNILVNIHRRPDLDSIGSATALYQALKKLGKTVTIICPHQIPEEFKFLTGAKEVKTIDFSTFDFAAYDLFLIVDSGSDEIVTGSKEIKLPDIKTIVIDHHRTNLFQDVKIKLYDEIAATCEIIYQMFLDWEITIDPGIATSLFSGIAGDTVFFKYSIDTKSTFKMASELLEKGADENKLIDEVFDSFDFNLIKMVGECLRKIEKGDSTAGKFVYSIIDYETFEKYGRPIVRELVANLFARSIKGFNFGIIIFEEEKGKFSLSFRSKKNTDVSEIAKKLGGGGHRNAAGASFYGTRINLLKKLDSSLKSSF